MWGKVLGQAGNDPEHMAGSFWPCGGQCAEELCWARVSLVLGGPF